MTDERMDSRHQGQERRETGRSERRVLTEAPTQGEGAAGVSRDLQAK